MLSCDFIFFKNDIDEREPIAVLSIPFIFLPTNASGR